MLPVRAVVRECELIPLEALSFRMLPLFPKPLPRFSLMWPDWGYGLFSLCPRFGLLCRLGLSPSEEDLKVVNFLTHAEKGRLRCACRSGSPA